MDTMNMPVPGIEVTRGEPKRVRGITHVAPRDGMPERWIDTLTGEDIENPDLSPSLVHNGGDAT